MPVTGIRRGWLLAFGLAAAGLLQGPAMGQDAPSVVKIVQSEGRWQLLRNGKPYFIKGVNGSGRLDLLVQSGGNSIRAGGQALDRAQQLGLTVLAGLRMGNPRQGFDYNNAELVAAQLESARQTVLRYKDHPALLMWALGNEMEVFATPQQRALVYKAVNEMAVAIKRIDPNHPVITVVGDNFRWMLREVNDLCPALDAVGLNAYVDMLTLPADVKRQGWTRPYVVTEFGPHGHWQVSKTAWDVPIEETSSEKAEFYIKAYRRAVAGQPQCLGSYAFLWGSKQEKTHTWYGMFLPDGSPTGAIDAMTYLWSGRWPANRSPVIGPGKIKLMYQDVEEVDLPDIPAGTRLLCEVDASDPEGGPLTIKWDLRKDVADNPSAGGDREEASPPIEGAVVSSEGKRATIAPPLAPGHYRIFVYVYDSQGAAATANLPIRVRN
jgi:hypothetical protein